MPTATLRSATQVTTEEVTALARVASIWENTRSEKEVVMICGEIDRGRFSNEYTEDESEWTPKDRKTKTEVGRCYTKKT